MPALEIVLKAKNETDAGFAAVAKNLKTTGEQAKATGTAVAGMSKSYTSASASAGKFADALGKTTTTLARSADAFGLNASAMRQLGDVADVAQLGFENLNKGVVGFNAASVGAAGAGFALGTAIGGLLRQIPEVAAAADAAAVSFTDWFARLSDGAKAAITNISPLAGIAGHVFGTVQKSAQEAAAATANWNVEAAKAAEIQKQVLDRATQGMSAQQIKEMLFPEPPKSYGEQLIEKAKAREEAEKKIAEAAKRTAEEQARAAERAAEVYAKAAEKARAEWDKFYENIRSRAGQMLDDQKKLIAGWADDYAEKVIKQREAYNEMVDAQIEDAKRLQEAQEESARAGWEAQIDAMMEAADAAINFGDVLGGVFGDIFNAAGNLLGAFANIKVSLDAMKNSGGGLTGLIGKISGGLGIAGTVIGVGKGLFDALFGGAKKAREEMNKLKNEFISSQGGMASLTAKAKEAGVALDAMFKAKSAAQLQAAISNIKGQLDLWGEAQDHLRDAMNEYGISVEQMGPKFAQQELDKEVAKVAEAFQLLTLAGADAGLVAEKMGEKVMELVRQYQTAGLAIPEALRPVLEAMLANGQLVDENGEAYASLEEAGIKFAESMTDAMKGLMEQVERLVQALAKGFNIPINFDYGSTGTGGGGGHGVPKEMPEFATGGPTGNYMGPAMVHPGEYMLNPETLARLEAVLAKTMAMARSAHGGGGMGAPIVVTAQVDRRALNEHINTQFRHGGIKTAEQQRGRRS